MPNQARLAAASRMRDIDVAFVSNDDIIAADALGNHFRFAAPVVGQHLLRPCNCIEPAVGTERLTVGSFGIGAEETYFPIKTDFVGFAVGNVVEEDLTLGIDGRTFGELVTFSHQLPVLAGQEKRL